MKKLKKRIISVLAAAIVSVPVGALATYSPPGGELPSSGMLFYDDYESFDTGKYNTVRNAEIIDIGEEYGKVMAVKPALNSSGMADMSVFFNLNKIGIDTDYTTCIREGQLLISHDVCVPSKTESGEDIIYNDQTSDYAQYMMNYALLENAEPGEYGTADWASEAGYFYAVYYSNEEPWITFNQNCRQQAPDETNGYVITFEPDTWHNLELLIDYDNAKMSYYWDGEYVGDYTGSSSFVSDYFGFFQLQLGATNKFADNENPMIYYDNFTVSRLESGSFGLTFAGCGENYVDLKANTNIDEEELLKLDAGIVNLFTGDSEYTAVDYELISSDTLRFYFDTQIAATGLHSVIIGGEDDVTTHIRSLYGDGFGAVAPGTGVSFIPETGNEAEDLALIDMTFDNEEDFPTEETSSSFDRYTYYGAVSQENPEFALDMDNAYIHCRPEPGTDGGNLLVLDNAAAAGQETKAVNAVKVPFADDMTVSEGVINIEFDAGIYKNGAGAPQTARLFFGLDNELAPSAEYLFDFSEDRAAEVWTNSSAFLGLTAWTDVQHCLTYACETNRTRTCDYYRESTSSGQTVNQISLVNDDTMQHYSITVDLGRKSYEISVEGGIPIESGYLPGSETEVGYNAFVMTLVDNNRAGTAAAKLDNLKVTASKAESARIENIEFYNLDGEIIPYSREMPSQTKKISIVFNSNVEFNASDYAIDGIAEEEYTAEYRVNENGEIMANIVDITLKNCLNRAGEYILTISGDTRIQDSGGTLGNDFKVSFTRADDAGLIYAKPQIDREAGTAKANVINLSDSDISGRVTVVGYISEDGIYRMSGVIYNEFTIEANTVVNVLEGCDISGIADGADRIAVYVFENAENPRLYSYEVYDSAQQDTV